VHEPSEEKSDDSKDSFYENSIRRFNAKVRRRIF
jgi:hypothetical protein